jgi:hypothetical protein
MTEASPSIRSDRSIETLAASKSDRKRRVNSLFLLATIPPNMRCAKRTRGRLSRAAVQSHKELESTYLSSIFRQSSHIRYSLKCCYIAVAADDAKIPCPACRPASAGRTMDPVN